jgi:hypothetical protein
MRATCVKTHGNIDLPSVTQVLKSWLDVSRVDLDFLKMAAARGTEVHAICAAIVKPNSGRKTPTRSASEWPGFP